jgi:HEAT repeat protein
VYSVDELFAVVVREQDDDSRWGAIQQLHALGTREVFERAVQLCRSALASERVAGADILGQLNAFSDEAMKILLGMFEDPTSRSSRRWSTRSDSGRMNGRSTRRAGRDARSVERAGTWRRRSRT